jgi:hyperosmotically inducible protein
MSFAESNISIMKFKIQKAISTLGIVVPLVLFGSGCQKNDNTGSTTTSADTSTNSTSATTNADNTANNSRDTNSGALTAADQSNSGPDVKITQQIRQQVVADTNHYSVDAKNIKIITTNGKVTLRGPVDTDTEKTGIAAIASNVAGQGNVDDQLEVKTNSTQQ